MKRVTIMMMMMMNKTNSSIGREKDCRIENRVGINRWPDPIKMNDESVRANKRSAVRNAATGCEGGAGFEIRIKS